MHNPYNITADPMFNHIFGKSLGKTMPATLTDPACNTPEYEARLDAEVKRLLKEPTELEDVDIDELVAIYIAHDKDVLDLGESFHRYMVKLATEQAEGNG